MLTFFAGTRPGRAITTGGGAFDLPVLYFRDDSFQAMFTADLRALKEVMPTDSLHPIAVAPGRGLLGVAAFDYLETSVGPYGEVGVVVPVVHGRGASPVLPALLESAWPGFGLLVLHLPVTERLARDGGRDVWGYTKFLATMSFQNTPELQECRLEEAGEHILTLRVVKRGLALPERRPLITYSVKDGALVRTCIPQRAVALLAFGAGGSSLELGESHPVADSIRALGIEPHPILTRTFLGRAAILPAGEVVERGVKPLEGYLGREGDGRRIEPLPLGASPPN